MFQHFFRYFFVCSSYIRFFFFSLLLVYFVCRALTRSQITYVAYVQDNANLSEPMYLNVSPYLQAGKKAFHIFYGFCNCVTALNDFVGAASSHVAFNIKLTASECFHFNSKENGKCSFFFLFGISFNFFLFFFRLHC